MRQAFLHVLVIILRLLLAVVGLDTPCRADAAQYGFLVAQGVGVAIDVDEVGRGEEVGGKLGLLIDHVVVVVSHQGTVVRVEELLSGVLGEGGTGDAAAPHTACNRQQTHAAPHVTGSRHVQHHM